MTEAEQRAGVAEISALLLRCQADLANALVHAGIGGQMTFEEMAHTAAGQLRARCRHNPDEGHVVSLLNHGEDDDIDARGTRRRGLRARAGAPP